MTRVAGIDIGGTNVKVVVLTDDGTVVARHRLPTDDSPGGRLPDDIARVLDDVEAAHGPLSAVGVACPGLVRPQGDRVYWMQGRLHVLEGLDWTRALRRSGPVAVVNDAQAALEGEMWCGAGRGLEDVVLLTLGTGVGGAVVSGGRVLTGAIGRAGHLGHIALRVPADKDIVNTPGSLEDAIGNCTLTRRSAGRFSTTEALVAAHRAGDAGATAIWHESVMHLAAGIASIVNVVDPARVILGGGIAVHAGEALMVPLRRWMDEYEWRPAGHRVEIVPAALGDEAGAMGAAHHAMVHASERHTS